MERVVGIAGSPRHGFTELYIGEVLRNVRELSGMETELISLAGKTIAPCTDCQACHRNDLPRLCRIKDDWNDIVNKLLTPDLKGLIIGSPVYCYNQSAVLAAFMERFTVFQQRNYHPDFHAPPPDWTSTVAGVLAVGGGRNGGQERVMGNLANWLLVNGFLIVGCYPRTSIGVACYEPTGTKQITDERALVLARALAINMVNTIFAFQNNKAVHPHPRSYNEAVDSTILGKKIGSKYPKEGLS